jgi:hypothetical protein
LRNPAVVLATAIALMPAFCGRAAAVDEPLEYQVKAAFLLNFTRFVDWPASAFINATSPFEICILGDDPFGSALDKLVSGETVGGRKVTIQRIRRTPQRGSCQVLYVGQTAKDVPQALTETIPGVLTVGETANFLSNGGIIQFLIENRRVRFDINQAAAEKAGLRISARLLNVARAVER